MGFKDNEVEAARLRKEWLDEGLDAADMGQLGPAINMSPEQIEAFKRTEPGRMFLMLMAINVQATHDLLNMMAGPLNHMNERVNKLEGKGPAHGGLILPGRTQAPPPNLLGPHNGN